MRRRDFIRLLGGGATAWPIAGARAATGPMRLIGVLMGYAESDSDCAVYGSGVQWMRSRSWGGREGSNLRIELRWSGADADRMQDIGKRAGRICGPMRSSVVTTAVIGALARETQTIPVVFAGVADPIASGFAANLARPGGNMTGFTVENSAARR